MLMTIGQQYTVLFLVELTLATLFSAFRPMIARKKKIYLVFSLGVMAILTMFHSENVGKDTSNYTLIFNRIANADLIYYMANTAIEKGFVVFCNTLSRINTNPQILFITTGAIAYLSIGRFLYKNISCPGIACALIVPLKIFDFFLTTQRQGISFAIMLFAFEYLKEKKYIKYFLCTILAMLFHNSAIVFMFIYFFINLKIFKIDKMNPVFYLKWLAFIAFITVFFQSFWNIALRIFPKYMYYEGTELSDGEPRLAVALRICVFGIMYFISVLMTDENDRTTQVINFMSLIHLSFVIIAWNATALNRFCWSFVMFPLIQYSIALQVQRKNNYKNFILILLISLVLFWLYGLIIAVYKTPDWYTTFPYSFCF